MSRCSRFQFFRFFLLLFRSCFPQLSAYRWRWYSLIIFFPLLPTLLLYTSSSSFFLFVCGKKLTEISLKLIMIFFLVSLFVLFRFSFNSKQIVKISSLYKATGNRYLLSLTLIWRASRKKTRRCIINSRNRFFEENKRKEANTCKLLWILCSLTVENEYFDFEKSFLRNFSLSHQFMSEFIRNKCKIEINRGFDLCAKDGWIKLKWCHSF